MDPHTDLVGTGAGAKVFFGFSWVGCSVGTVVVSVLFGEVFTSVSFTSKEATSDTGVDVCDSGLEPVAAILA